MLFCAAAEDVAGLVIVTIDAAVLLRLEGVGHVATATGVVLQRRASALARALLGLLVAVATTSAGPRDGSVRLMTSPTVAVFLRELARILIDLDLMAIGAGSTRARSVQTVFVRLMA
jgi:hypothetical protein